MISVVIVEREDSVREQLRDWLDSGSSCRCVYACASSSEALIGTPDRLPSPEVLLMELRPMDETEFFWLDRLKQKLEETRIVVLTSSKENDTILRALKAGASGYLLKPSSRQEILWAIAEVTSGGAPLSSEISRRVVESFHQKSAPRTDLLSISPRETEVLEVLARGMSTKQIASLLGISYETVCVHLRRIYKKLNVRSRTEAVVKHLRARTITPEDPEIFEEFAETGKTSYLSKAKRFHPGVS